MGIIGDVMWLADNYTYLKAIKNMLQSKFHLASPHAVTSLLATSTVIDKCTYVVTCTTICIATKIFLAAIYHRFLLHVPYGYYTYRWLKNTQHCMVIDNNMHI